MVLTGCASNQIKQSIKTSQIIDKKHYGSFVERVSLPDLGPDSPLRDYLRYAALNNGELEAAFNQWKAALEKIPQAKSLPDPMLNFTVYVEEVETRVGPQEFLIGGSQKFPWLTKLALLGDMAADTALAAQQRYEDAKLKLFFEVRDAYAELYYLGRSIEITKNNIQLLNYFEKVAQTKYRAAVGAHPDVIKVQVELGKLEDRLKTLEELKGPMTARVNAALNRSVHAPVPWPKEIPEETIPQTDRELVEWVLENSPRLNALAFDAEKEKKRVQLAKQSYYPDLTVGADYISTGSAVINTPESGKDPVLLKVQATVPIWFDRYGAEVREAESMREAAQKKLQDARSQIASKTKMAAFQFRDAKRKINLFRDSLIPKAEQSLSTTQKAFESGSVDFLTLIDAQRVLLEFSLSYERALTDQAKKLAELEMLIGRRLPAGGMSYEDILE